MPFAALFFAGYAYVAWHVSAEQLGRRGGPVPAVSKPAPSGRTVEPVSVVRAA
jgi:hypothetical protein